MGWLFSSATYDSLTSASSLPKGDYGSKWGVAPEGPGECEMDPNELVLQSWAFCKSKKNPYSEYRTESDEKSRRQRIQWRKRASFLQLDCGDDSFMVSNTYHVVGVADGVGGWREKGIDPSLIANKLMENCKLYSETHRDDLDAKRILTEAYNKLTRNREVDGGSTTACIACLRPGDAPDQGILDIANVGDSGAILVRDREVIQRVHEKVHSFNAPFQLSVIPENWKNKGFFEDQPSDCIRERWSVQEGDVLVLGTDGLFDNLSVGKIAEDAGWIGRVSDPWSYIPFIGGMLKSIFGTQSTPYIDPYRVAQRIATEAWNLSTNPDAVTPFALTLQDLGVRNNGRGGKQDDITVLIARVVSRSETKRIPVW